MTKNTLTIGSTDLSEHVQSTTIDMAAPGTVSQGFIQTVRLHPPSQSELEYKRWDWESVMDDTVRVGHRDLTSKVFVFDCITTPSPPSFAQAVGRLKRCRCYADDIFAHKALRTYPKRMSRAKRKEARAREQRRWAKIIKWLEGK